MSNVLLATLEWEIQQRKRPHQPYFKAVVVDVYQVHAFSLYFLKIFYFFLAKSPNVFILVVLY